MCLSGAHLRFLALPWRSWQRPRAQTRNHILGVRAQGPGSAGAAWNVLLPCETCAPATPQGAVGRKGALGLRRRPELGSPGEGGGGAREGSERPCLAPLSPAVSPRSGAGGARGHPLWGPPVLHEAGAGPGRGHAGPLAHPEQPAAGEGVAREPSGKELCGDRSLRVASPSGSQLVAEPGGREVPLSAMFIHLLSASWARPRAGSGQEWPAELTLSPWMSPSDCTPTSLPTVACTVPAGAQSLC